METDPLCGDHQSPVDFPHKGQRGGTLMFSLICAWTSDSANPQDAGDLRRHRPHYDVTVMVPGALMSVHKTSLVVVNSYAIDLPHSGYLFRTKPPIMTWCKFMHIYDNMRIFNLRGNWTISPEWKYPTIWLYRIRDVRCSHCSVT